MKQHLVLRTAGGWPSVCLFVHAGSALHSIALHSRVGIAESSVSLFSAQGSTRLLYLKFLICFNIGKNLVSTIIYLWQFCLLHNSIWLSWWWHTCHCERGFSSWSFCRSKFSPQVSLTDRPLGDYTSVDGHNATSFSFQASFQYFLFRNNHHPKNLGQTVLLCFIKAKGRHQ